MVRVSTRAKGGVPRGQRSASRGPVSTGGGGGSERVKHISVFLEVRFTEPLAPCSGARKPHQILWVESGHHARLDPGPGAVGAQLARWS